MMLGGRWWRRRGRCGRGGGGLRSTRGRFFRWRRRRMGGGGCVRRGVGDGAFSVAYTGSGGTMENFALWLWSCVIGISSSIYLTCICSGIPWWAAALVFLLCRYRECNAADAVLGNKATGIMILNNFLPTALRSTSHMHHHLQCIAAPKPEVSPTPACSTTFYE